jgi:mono/diheme cytochrome c family protein
VIKLHTRRWRWLLLLMLVTGGCAPPGEPRSDERPVPADEVMDFSTLYSTHCCGCHGADGKLGPAPPLNDPIFVAIVPEAELLRVIRDGRAVTRTQKSPMPAFGLPKKKPLPADQLKVLDELMAQNQAAPMQKSPLTGEQIKALAKGIKEHWGQSTSQGGSVPPYSTPAGSRGGDEKAGRSVFAKACAGCHGSQGQGGKYGDRRVGAISDPNFLALISDQALRRYAITGRPDLGMPAYDSKAGRSRDFQPLTSAEIDDLVALLAHWRQGGRAKVH